MDRYPTLTFPTEDSPQQGAELNALVSQLWPRVPIDIPFSLSNFEMRSGMTIAISEGQVHQFSYIRESPDLFFVEFATSFFTLGGTPNTAIRLRLPEGRIGIKQSVVVGHGADNGVFMPLRVTAGGNAAWINVFKSDLTNWTPSAQTAVAFQIRVRLAPVAT